MSNFQKQIQQDKFYRKLHNNEHFGNAEDNSISEELKEKKRLQFTEAKARQQIRETNQELKELEVKLRAAYVAKSISTQLAEKKLQACEEKLQQKHEQERLQKKLADFQELKKQEEQKEIEKKLKLRQDLQQQIDLTIVNKSKLYEEFLKEKKIFDEITNKIYDEQLEEMREKLAKQEQFRCELEKFLYAQKIWKERQKTEMEEEDKRLKEFLEEKDEIMREETEKRRLEEQEKATISQMLGEKLKEKSEAKQKRENLLIDLYVEESKEKAEIKFREEMEQQLRRRILTRIHLAEQREDIFKRKQREQEEDRLFWEDQMRLLAERDKLEQLSDEKRRKKILEHRRAVQEGLEEKKQRRAEELACLIKQREQDVNEEKRKQRLIEEERIKILQEHASALIGFLPPGILRESDREFLPLPSTNR